MRVVALIIFGCCMATLALSLEGCAQRDIHPSTATLEWVD